MEADLSTILLHAHQAINLVCTEQMAVLGMADDSSPPCSYAVRIAAASASETMNIPAAWGCVAGQASKSSARIRGGDARQVALILGGDHGGLSGLPQRQTGRAPSQTSTASWAPVWCSAISIA
jgi:hypothetical protein